MPLAPLFNPLLDLPAFPANRYAEVADRLKRVLHTGNDLVIVQGEAILALEAAATSLARPGLVALNLVTSPYGGYFGGWLKRGGAIVHEVAAEGGQPIAVAAVEQAIAALPHLDVVAMVHAETSSGILNPLEKIAGLVKARGALLVVDAVASVGGHALDVESLGIDICVIGPQKALGGPAGLSAASISAKAWAAMGEAPDLPPSSLSLPYLKRSWLDHGRGALPGMPSALEFWALEAALDRLDAEGLDEVIARHRRAAEASHAALRAMGIGPFVADIAAASNLATAAPVPEGIGGTALLEAAAEFGVNLTPGFGAVRGKLVRLDHAGARAAFAPVMANITAYGTALRQLGRPVDVGAGAEAVAAVYRG